VRLAFRSFLLGPTAPRVSVERILSIWSEKFHQLLPSRIGEAGADADMLQVSVIIIETQQQRPDLRFLAPLVPAKSGDDAIALALVLHLQHDSLVRFISPIN